MKFSASLVVITLIVAASASPLHVPRGRGGDQRGRHGQGGNHKGSAAPSSAASVAASSSVVRSAAAIASSKAVGTTATSTVIAGNGAAAGSAAGGGDPQSSLTLLNSVIATGFENNGQNVPEAGQVPSLTSSNNFINFCATLEKPITNGLQISTGSCNPAPMGVIAATTNMPSAKFVFPENGATVPANKDFTIQMAIKNLVTGNFVNAAENYFSAPQQIDSATGNINGHSHFVFFKGLNAAAQGGILTADVPGGLPAGSYRIASINSAANHQAVLVAVAQHGALDDMA
ncbi:hypothetical protein LXA43DRAFT_1059756 [Ganoderma leucocontextum]|nr:hypothetical protein LXA43DRAFT_1059756 [Ganoderma leucocontextum]